MNEFLESIIKRDPAAKSKLSIILTYPGAKAVFFHKIIEKIIEMIKDKTITEGMIPKINTCLDAVKNDVTAVGIIDGRKPRSVLFELFSDKGSGTLIRK